MSMTLHEWVKAWNQPARVVSLSGVYAIPDTAKISHGRTYLFGLSDAKVSSVQGGTIWLHGPAADRVMIARPSGLYLE